MHFLLGDNDLVVIGSGPGGYVASIKAAQLGMKVSGSSSSFWKEIIFIISDLKYLYKVNVWNEIAQYWSVAESHLHLGKNSCEGIHDNMEYLLF